MLPADAALVRADPGIPGLAVLLDDTELTAWLAVHAPQLRLVRRRYLRHKPGTSCVLGLDVRTADGTLECYLTAHTPDAADKQDKTVDKAVDGTVLVTDPERVLLLGTVAADRDLPALTPLATVRGRTRLLRRLLPGTSWNGATLRTLSHKPHRRWVGLLRPVTGAPVLLRAHRPAVAEATVPVLRALAAAPPRTPHVLGTELGLGLVAVEHLPGRVLDQALRAHAAGPGAVVAAGAALA